MRMGRRAGLLLSVVLAVLLACAGVALAQSTTPNKGVQQPSNSSASTTDPTANDDGSGYRGPPEAKQPRNTGSGRQEKTAPTESPSRTPSSQATQATAATGQRVLGAWIQNVWTNPPQYISEFNNMVGNPAHVIMYYQNWEQLDKKDFDPAKMDAAVNSGAMPMVTWASRDPNKGANQSKYTDKNIVNGKFDAYIKKWADDAKAWGKPMYLRFDHEMNGTWFPWSPGVNGNTTTDWINAWKHVHDIFVKEGATNVKWVWSPYVNCGGCQSLSKVYPGDAYVDWVALDGYNWGGSNWLTVAQVFGTSYDTITNQVAPSKPFMIAEISSAEDANDPTRTRKAKWITDAFSTDQTTHPGSIPNRMPKTQAVVWFSADKRAQGEQDWRVNSSDNSLAAYKVVAADPAWQGLLTGTP